MQVVATAENVVVELTKEEAERLSVILHGYLYTNTEGRDQDPDVILAGELCGRLNAAAQSQPS